MSWQHSTVQTSAQVVASRNPGGAMRDNQETVLLFALPAGCVEHADLDLGAPVGHLPAGAVAVYTSALAETAGTATATPRTVTPTETVLDTRPRGELRLVEGRAHVDVTDIARLWQAGGPYGQQGRYVRQGAPIGLEVMPVSLLGGPRFAVRFGSPVLTVTARADRPCGYTGPTGAFAPTASAG